METSLLAPSEETAKSRTKPEGAKIALLFDRFDNKPLAVNR